MEGQLHFLEAELRFVPSLDGDPRYCALEQLSRPGFFVRRCGHGKRVEIVESDCSAAFALDCAWDVQPDRFFVGTFALAVPRNSFNLLRRHTAVARNDPLSEACACGTFTICCDLDDGSVALRREASWYCSPKLEHTLHNEPNCRGLWCHNDAQHSKAQARDCGVASTNEASRAVVEDDDRQSAAGSVNANKSSDDGRFQEMSVEVARQVADATAKLQCGQQEEAKRLLHEVLKKHPADFDALFMLAFASDVSHDHDMLAVCINRAVRMNPLHAHAWLFKGMSDSRQGNYHSAVAAFSQARELDPGGAIGEQARGSLEMLLRNMGCLLSASTCWADAAPKILLQPPRLDPIIVGTDLLPPRPPFRAQHPVHVWDDVLSPTLLRYVLDSVDDLCTWGLRNPQRCNTFWLARGAEAKVAAEMVGRHLLEKVLGCRNDEFVGIEWWCKNQSANLGAHFHYDTAVADGGLLRPSYSSVLYLADEGGPTVIFDQAADLRHDRWPHIPQESYVVMPRINRWMVFPGELRHGMIAIDDDTSSRWVILYNFWSVHTPGPPNCQIPDFSTYYPVSAWSMTSKYILGANILSNLTCYEDSHSVNIQKIDVDCLTNPEDLPCSSDFGEFPFSLPMPPVSKLRSGSAKPAVLYLPWRELAAKVLSRSLDVPSSTVPFSLGVRLMLRELPLACAEPV